MTRLQRFVVIFAIIMPFVAAAADIPVTYTVEEKRLKDALAGTPLTFQLFRDNACTAPPGHSTIILVENVTLITKMKQFTPKNDVKLPKLVELRTTLPNVTLNGNLYLKVTGTGVVPVGGACQAQAAQVVAPNCFDAIQNQTETDVDCGGPNFCQRCQGGETCAIGSDCASQICTSGACEAVPTCTDGIQNGSESDIDCGGGMCPQCGVGQMCNHPLDCATGICIGNVCSN